MTLRKFQTWNGDRYRLIAREEGLLPHGVQPVAFYDSDSAVQFIRNLKASESEWRGLLRLFGDDLNPNNPLQIEQVFADKLIKGKLRAVKLSSKTTSSNAPTSFSSGTGVVYQIQSSVDLLESGGSRTKQMTDVAQAEKFIERLGASEKQLETIAKDLGLDETKALKQPMFNQASPSKADQLKQKIAKALSENDAVVVEKSVSAPPASESGASQGGSEVGHMAGNRMAGLGPVVESAAQKGEKKEPECVLQNVVLSCSHGRTFQESYLDVVPSETGDTITLKSVVEDKCGDHPEWEVSGPIGNKKINSASGSFKANHWRIGSPSPTILNEAEPQKYDISVKSCGRSESLTVYSYPSDKISLKISGFGKDKSIQEKLDYIEDSLGQYLKKFKFSALSGSVSFSGQWVENNDHRAFYRYQISGGFNPLFGLTLRVPFGPTAAIPEWVKRHGDLYCFVEFSGGVSTNLNFERLRPEKLTGYFEAKGSIDGKLGASLFLMNDNVLKVEAFGSTGINFKGWTDKELKDPIVYGQFDWEGLKMTLSIQVAWGWIETSREWSIVDGDVLNKDPWQLNLKEIF